MAKGNNRGGKGKSEPEVKDSQTEGSETEAQDEDDFFSGFDVTVEQKRADGWFKKEAGNTIKGRLMGISHYKTDDNGKQSAVFQVKISEPCVCMTGSLRDGDQAEEELDRGSIVNVEGAAFRDLESYCGNGGIYDIAFRYTDRVPVTLKNGKTIKMWQGEGPKLRQLRAPKPGWEQEAALKRAQKQGGKQTYDASNTDDIPF